MNVTKISSFVRSVVEYKFSLCAGFEWSDSWEAMSHSAALKWHMICTTAILWMYAIINVVMAWGGSYILWVSPYKVSHALMHPEVNYI